MHPTSFSFFFLFFSFLLCVQLQRFSDDGRLLTPTEKKINTQNRKMGRILDAPSDWYQSRRGQKTKKKKKKLLFILSLSLYQIGESPDHFLLPIQIRMMIDQNDSLNPPLVKCETRPKTRKLRNNTAV
jgi:hypothetical protein